MEINVGIQVLFSDFLLSRSLHWLSETLETNLRLKLERGNCDQSSSRVANCYCVCRRFGSLCGISVCTCEKERAAFSIPFSYPNYSPHNNPHANANIDTNPSTNLCANCHANNRTNFYPDSDSRCNPDTNPRANFFTDRNSFTNTGPYAHRHPFAHASFKCDGSIKLGWLRCLH
jgi:hypothetical protein